MSQKHIIIAIGGSGLSALRYIRSLNVETFGQGNLENTRFLYIDTHDQEYEDQKANKKQWSSLGTDISFNANEMAILPSDGLTRLIEQPEDFPEINQWLPEIKNNINSVGDGAKGFRPYGKLVYEENKELIREKLNQAVEFLNNQNPHVTKVKFHVIAGLSGGTGSSMFMLLASDLLEWGFYEKGEGNYRLFGYLLLPPRQAPGFHDRYHSNAYAALKELNYEACKQKRQFPFDNCYLVAPENESHVQINKEQLPLLVAQRIFLEVQDNEATNQMPAIMDNPNDALYDLEFDGLKRNYHAKCFSTFGLANVSFPRETIAKYLSSFCAVEVLNSWLISEENLQDIYKQAENSLDSLQLSDEYLLRNKNPFNPLNSYTSFDEEITRIIEDSLGNLEKSKKQRLVEKANEANQMIETDFRELGVKVFYDRCWGDISRAVEKSLKLLKQQISKFIQDPKKGLDYAEQFLQELLVILERRQQSFQELTSNHTQHTIERLRTNFNQRRDEVRQREDKWFYRRFKEDQEQLKISLQDYWNKQAEVYATAYANEFLTRFLDEVKHLPSQVSSLKNRLSQIKNKLNGFRNEQWEEIKNNSMENGVIIINNQSIKRWEEQLEKVFDELKGALQENLLSESSQEPNLFAFLKRHSNDDLKAKIADYIFHWLLSEQSPLNIMETSICDQMLENYSVEKNQNLLQEALSLSQPFLRFSRAEMKINKINPNVNKIATLQRETGVAENNNQNSSLQEIYTQLSNIIPRNEIYRSNNSHRITFLTEKQGFPLRSINIIAHLENQYRNANDPYLLHLDKRLVPHLYDLYYPSERERRRQHQMATENAYIFGRVLGWLYAKRKPRDGNEEAYQIRYDYKDENMLQAEPRVIGGDWLEAYECLIHEQPNPEFTEVQQQLIQRSENKLKEASYSRQTSKQLEEAFKAHLTSLKKALDEDEDHPEYLRDSRLINRIYKQLLS